MRLARPQGRQERLYEELGRPEMGPMIQGSALVGGGWQEWCPGERRPLMSWLICVKQLCLGFLAVAQMGDGKWPTECSEIASLAQPKSASAHTLGRKSELKEGLGSIIASI